MDAATAETATGQTAATTAAAEATSSATAPKPAEDALAAQATTPTTRAIAEEAAGEMSAALGATRVRGSTDVPTTTEALAKAEMKEASPHAATAGIGTTAGAVPGPLTARTAPLALEAFAPPATKEAPEEGLEMSRGPCRLAQRGKSSKSLDLPTIALTRMALPTGIE